MRKEAEEQARRVDFENLVRRHAKDLQEELNLRLLWEAKTCADRIFWVETVEVTDIFYGRMQRRSRRPWWKRIIKRRKRE